MLLFFKFNDGVDASTTPKLWKAPIEQKIIRCTIQVNKFIIHDTQKQMK